MYCKLIYFFRWKFDKKYSFVEKVDEFINSSLKLDNDGLSEAVLDNYQGNTAFDQEMRGKIFKKIRIKAIWTMKVMRFITYCLNGGLTDFTLTLEKFISELVNKIQSFNNDIQDLVYRTICLIDLDNIQEGIVGREKLATLSETSRLVFNEEAMAINIKSGYLAKYISEYSSGYARFINIILTNNCTNKILSKSF